MNTYNICFLLTNKAAHQRFIEFMKNSGLGITLRFYKTLSPNEAALADAIFVDEKTANRQCSVLSEIKTNQSRFIPVLLLASGGSIEDENIPECIDDIIFKSSSQVLLKKRLRTYLHIRESEDKMKTIFNSSPSAMLLVNKNFEVEMVNKKLLEFKKYKIEDVKGKKCYKVFRNKHQVCVDCTVNKVLKTGKPATNEYSLQLPNGENLFYSSLAYPIQDGNNNITHVFQSSTDITKQKEAQKRLKESEQNYHNLIQYSKNCIAVYSFLEDGEIIIKDFNHAAEKLEKVLRKDITGKKLKEVFPGVEEFGIYKALQEVHRTGRPREIPEKFYHDNRIAGWRENYLYRLPSGDVVAIYQDVSKEKQVEQLLKESEQKYRSLAETSSDLILTFDLSGKFTYLSPSLTRMTGYRPEEILNRNFWEFLAPEYVESTIENFKRGIIGEHIPLYEIELLHKSGHRVPIELNVTSLLNADGNPIGRLAVARDITGRRNAEEALKKSEARLKKFSQITTEGIVIHNNGLTVDANHAFLDITGYKLDDILGRNIVELTVKSKYQKLVHENMQKEHAVPYDIEAVKKDGTSLYVELSGIDYVDKNGDVARAVVVRDISWRRQMEKALRESEQKYRSLTEGSIDMILTYDLNGIITYVNPVAKEIYGYSPEEIIGTKFTDYVSPEYINKVIDSFNKGKQGERISLYELAIIHKSGRKIPIEVNPGSIFDDKGNIISRLSVVRDISVRKEAEKALLLNNKALNAAANAIVITAADGKVEWVNQAFSKLSGFTLDESIGKRMAEIVGSGKQDQAFFENLNKTLASGQVWKGEFIDKRKDGTLYEIEEIITPVTDQKGKVEHLIGIMTDITERKAAERELRAAKEAAEESSRLKSAFLANMNHEIRTPMSAIIGFSELMLKATYEEKEEYAEIVNRSAGQLLHLIDDVIFLSRLQSEKLPVNPVHFYPADLLKDIFLMFNLPEMRKNLKLKLQLPKNAESIVIAGDADKITQVMTNLTTNAVKYTQKGYVKLGFEIDGTNIIFFVEDSGIGIPETEQKRIFDAFYRTNSAITAAIRGTGLGLNIAKELVELMDGSIHVSSKPGKGSRFFFILPFEPVKGHQDKTPIHLPVTKKWEELNILIAEDDNSNFLYLDVLLNNKVNRIDRALNGLEAVEMVKKNTYDIVLMDLKMPLMSGVEATREIKKLFPLLPVIAATACATTEEKDNALDAGCDGYITKPIKKEEFIKLIDQFVSGRS